MSWNYRVINRKYNHPLTGEETNEYGIYEVFYNKNGTIYACSKHKMEPHGETIYELIADLEFMKAALEKPILNYDDIKPELVTQEE